MSNTSAFDRPQSLFTTLAAGLRGLGRWHDLELVVDRPALRASADGLSYVWNEGETLNWGRGSRRQDRFIPMQAVKDSLATEGNVDDVTLAHSILGFGTRCFIGADVAFGCGRYTLTAA